MSTREFRSTPLLLGRRMRTVSRAPIGFVSPEIRAADSENGLVTYCGESHLVTIGRTGAGKTSQAVCNALNYAGSMVVFDSTGALYEATARRRAELGQEVHVIDLRDGARRGTGSLNPLDLAVRGGMEKAVIARSFAAHLVARTGHERESFWADWTETVIAGGIGYAFTLPSAKQNLSTVFDLFNEGDTFASLATILDDKKRRLNRSTRAALNGLLQLPDQGTRPSVLGCTQAALRLWDSDLVRRTTCTTSFDIDALIHEPDAHPMSIFVIVPAYREAYRPLLRLWLSGLLTALMQRRRLPRLRTLLLSDETASFGRVDAFLTAATQARSFGVQLWTHWQNPAQLEVYGRAGAHTLVDNAGVLQLLGAANLRVAHEFASLVGGISAEEIMGMGPHDQLLLMDGTFQRLRRLRYFEEPQFAGHFDPVMQAEPAMEPCGLSLDA